MFNLENKRINTFVDHSYWKKHTQENNKKKKKKKKKKPKKPQQLVGLKETDRSPPTWSSERTTIPEAKHQNNIPISISTLPLIRMVPSHLLDLQPIIGYDFP